MQLRYSHDLPPFLFGLPAIADRQVLKHSVSVRPIISRSTLLCWTLETENGWVAVQRSYAVFCGYVAIYFKLSTAAPPQPENSEARPQIQKLFQGSPANGIHFSIPSRLVFSILYYTDLTCWSINWGVGSPEWWIYIVKWHNYGWYISIIFAVLKGMTSMIELHSK